VDFISSLSLVSLVEVQHIPELENQTIFIIHFCIHHSLSLNGKDQPTHSAC